MIEIRELTDKEKKKYPAMEFEVVIGATIKKFTRPALFELYKKSFEALNK